MLCGDEPPEDRSNYQLVMDLIHAATTGQFPQPGSLRDQPTRIYRAFRIVHGIKLIADRGHKLAKGLDSSS